MTVFALCPYVWTEGDLPCWTMPDGARHGLDLRTLAEMGTAGGTPASSLFVFERAADVPRGGTILSDDPEGTLSQEAGQALADLCGFSRRSKTLRSTRFDGALFEALTTAACAPGTTGPRPLIPTRRGLELNLGPIRKRVAFDIADPELSPAVLAVLQEDFRAIRADALSRGSDIHQKVLGWWMKRYKTDDPTLFQPADLERTETKEPATTITESFNTADSTTLGPDLTWTEVSGTSLRVISIRLSISADGSGCAARADHDLSSSDNYAQATLEALATSISAATIVVGVGCRFSSSAYTCYVMRLSRQASDTVRLEKRVSGTGTALTSDGAVTVSVPDAIKVQAEGTTLKGFYAGIEEFSITDSAISTGIRGGVAPWFLNGLYADGDAAADDFEAGDLAAGPAGNPRAGSLGASGVGF